MARITHEERRHLEEVIRTHEFLRRMTRHIEHLHRIVFHAQTAHLDSRFIRDSAEEILIADLLTRFDGDIDQLYHSIRQDENRGKSWAKALADHAAYAHNYFTTPLGVVLRRDIFGDESHFVTPAAGRYHGKAALAPAEIGNPN